MKIVVIVCVVSFVNDVYVFVFVDDDDGDICCFWVVG